MRVTVTDKGHHELAPDSKLVCSTNEFLRSLRLRGLSSHTVRAYAYDLALFLRWFSATEREIEQLLMTDLVDFIGAQRKLGSDPRSINRRLSTVRLLYRFCTGHDLAPVRGVTLSSPHYQGPGRDHNLGLHRLRRHGPLQLRAKEAHKLVEPLTPQQVRSFLRSLRRYRDLALVHLMLLCGLRSAEVLALELTDVVFDDARIRVRGKGSRDRMLPLPGILAELIRHYLHWERPRDCTSRQLFLILQGKRRGSPMTPAGLRSIFRHRRRRAALKAANAHRFRHTFGADMARANVRLPILQRLMGHADSKTTLQYIQLSMTDVVAEYQRAMKELQQRYGHQCQP